MNQSVESLREQVYRKLVDVSKLSATHHAGKGKGLLSDKLDATSYEFLQAFALFLDSVEWPEKEEEQPPTSTFEGTPIQVASRNYTWGYNRGVKDSITAFNSLMEGLRDE